MLAGVWFLSDKKNCMLPHNLIEGSADAQRSFAVKLLCSPDIIVIFTKIQSFTLM
jgi:hypothetical protein